MPALTPGDAQDILATYKRGWERRDPDTLMALFRDDAVFRADPFSDELSGANSIRQFVNEVCASTANVEFDAERTWVAGSTVLASWHAAFTHRADGSRVRQRGFMTVELDEQKLISRLRQWPVERVVGTDSTHKTEE